MEESTEIRKWNNSEMKPELHVLYRMEHQEHQHNKGRLRANIIIDTAVSIELVQKNLHQFKL